MQKELVENSSRQLDLKTLLNEFIRESIARNTLKRKKYESHYKGLEVKVSFGQGSQADVSWMAFVGHGQHVSEGIYPVILFNRKDCLVLAYGVSETKKSIDWPSEIISKYKKIKDANCECDLSIIKNKYPSSYIKRCFRIDSGMMSDKQFEELLMDLNDMVETYNDIFKEEMNYNKFNVCLQGSTLKLELYVINSFYNALKTKGFVILAGLSGTGKTKIFEEFVKCFPSLEKNKKEKWIVIRGAGEKLLPVKKEEIEFNNGKIEITNFIEAVNETLESETNRKIYLKINNYYTELIPVIEKLRNKTDLIGASEINNHLAVYIGSLFGFEIIEKEDIEKFNLQKLEHELEIKELEENFKNSLFLPIHPDFKDTKSLLGFYNPLKEQYHSTPLLDFILEASINYLEKGKYADPFFVLFDEMNLARVEYYFADFLSILESKRFDKKEDTLNKNTFTQFLKTLGKDNFTINENNFRFTSQSIKLHNEENINDVPKELFLPPNLYFVGTVNVDETTHMFSPKVLDRAFTIEFDVGDFSEYLEFLNTNSQNSELPEEIKEQLKQDFINNGEFAIIDKEKIREFTKENTRFVEKLEEINQVLKRYNLHFGYRVFDEIIMFLYNSQNSKYPFADLDEAFDLAIKMKVLPKFHGTRQKLEEPIIEFLRILELQNEELGDNGDNQGKDIVKEISEELKGIPIMEEKELNNEQIQILKLKLNNKEDQITTPYIYTTHKLLEMLYKLKTQGFASFM